MLLTLLHLFNIIISKLNAHVLNLYTSYNFLASFLEDATYLKLMKYTHISTVLLQPPKCPLGDSLRQFQQTFSSLSIFRHLCYVYKLATSV